MKKSLVLVAVATCLLLTAVHQGRAFAGEMGGGAITAAGPTGQKNGTETMAAGTPMILKVKFPTRVPGDGTPVNGKIAWLDTAGDLVNIRAEFVVCPPGFTCTDFNLPVTSAKKFGVLPFSMWCVNDTDTLVTFGMEFIPSDVFGEGDGVTISFDCLP